MPSDTASEFTPRRRLHRLSWLFVGADYLRHFIAPLAIAIIVGARNDNLLWGLAFIIPLVVGALWQQWVYRYDFGPRGLVIRDGLFFRNVRNIDYRRIENVDTRRNLLHRLMDVVEVRVETSSGGASEAVIRVLDQAAAQEMRQRIFAGRNQTAEENSPAKADEDLLLHLGPGELIRYGLIDNRGMIVIAAVVGIAFETGRQKVMETWLQGMTNVLPIEAFAGYAPVLKALLLFSAAAGLIAGTRVLSVLLAFITLHDFRLTRSGEDFRIRHGLLTRVSLTMRRPRIQAVHWKASLLHRLFRRVSVRADLAGGLAGSNDAGGENNGQASQRKLWLAPVCMAATAQELTHLALPQVDTTTVVWQRLPTRARWRLFRLLTLAWLVIGGAPLVFLLQEWAAAIILPALPFIWLHAHLYVKYTGWALHGEFFALRRGWLSRRLSFVPRNRIQSVRLAESPFDRRYRMASLDLDTAGASAQRIGMRYLDREVAEKLLQALRSAPA